MKRILSFGGGHQSTALALNFIQEDIDVPRPDAVVFADTGWERESTYRHVESFSKVIEAAGIPFVTVSGGNLLEILLNPDNPRTEMPSFINPSRWETLDGLRELFISDAKKQYAKLAKAAKNEGMLFELPELDEVLRAAEKEFDIQVSEGRIKEGWKEMDTAMLGRQCTQRLKIRPIRKFLREEMGATKENPVGQYIGISLDEWHRMTTDDDPRYELLYPLVKARITREDCQQYILDSGYPLPEKSACIGCPYHSNETWRSLNDAELEQAMHVEQILNHFIKNSPLRERAYFAQGTRFHASMKPLYERPHEDNSESLEALMRDGVCGVAGCFLNLPFLLAFLTSFMVSFM